MTAARSRGRVLLRVGLALLVGGVSAAVIVGLFIWRAPLAALSLAGRTTLRVSGFEKTTIAASGGRITYFRKGTGPTVVFLHGANDQAGTWARIAPALAADHHVVVVDLAGHGDSEPLDGPLKAADLLDGVVAVVEAERRGTRATLVGNSLGGWLALVYAYEHPDATAQAILVNGAINRDDRSGAAVTLLPRTRDEARHTMSVLLSPASPGVPDFVLDDLVRRAPTSPLARLMAQPESDVARFLIDDRLGDLHVPVTLIWGEDDRLLSLAYARSAAARIPGARLEILKDCGHIPQRECAGPLLARLRESLARVPAAPLPTGGGV